MNAVLSVVGKDTIGILSKVANVCTKYDANVEDVRQTVIDNYFAMFMIVNIDSLKIDFNLFVDELVQLGIESNLKIHVMHEDIFNSMHKI